MAARQTFKRNDRLLKAGEFSRVFERRHVRRGRYFTLHWCERDPAESGDRLGVVIAKRLLKTAVHRNLLKRLCREAFRRRSPVRSGAPRFDIVLRLAVKLDPAAAGRERKALAADLVGLFNALACKTARP